MEVVVVMGVTAVGGRTPYHRLSIDGIHTGHIQCHRVEGGKHSHIGNNGGVSSRRDSQLGDTSMTSEIWKQGRPSTTALEYSAIFRFRDSSPSRPSRSGWRSGDGSAPRAAAVVGLPAPQRTGRCGRRSWYTSRGHAVFMVHMGFPALCCSIFPARLPQPCRVLQAPRRSPPPHGPLKWVREMNTSASMTARPILASFTSSPPATGTATSSLPLMPSAMMT